MDKITVNRFDAGELVGSLSETPQGFLTGVARVTRIGIFDYMNADGSLKRELRHPNEVFKKSSLDSMKMIPITNDHPKAKEVNADNAKELSIGYTGEAVKVDGQFVEIPITITHQDGIAALKAGRRELSLGYLVRLEDTKGNFDGAEYDCIQRDIEYNHLAIVDKARAGSACSVKIDGADAVQVINEDDTNINSHLQGGRMVKITLDSGIEYDAAPEVKVALDAANKKIADDKALVEASVKAADEAKAKADSAIAELETFKKRDIDGEIKAAVKARASLERAAASVLDADTVAKFDSMDDKAIKTAVILKQSPALVLDGKSDDYIAARFESAVEVLANHNDAAASQRKAAGSESQNNNDGTDPVEKAKKAYLDRTLNAYKADSEEK